jgi:ankyrin repeat protein
MLTPDIRQDHEVAACSDEDLDWEAFSQHSSEVGLCKDPTWKTQWPLQYSMNPSVKAAGNPEEPPDYAKWAIYQDAAILDASGGRGKAPMIRLLRVKTGTDTDPVCCELVKRPLWDAGNYSALSYSWGLEEPSGKIFVESRNTSPFPFPVSPHLFTALRRLRNEHSAVNVWIDAICINQSDIMERAAQVQIMAQIFNAASEVRVWLGEYSGSEGDFHTTDRELFWSLCQRSSPWWTRLCIIQECAYATREPVIMIGACSMTFAKLIKRWQSVIRGPEDSVNSEVDDALATSLESLRMPFDAWEKQMVDGTHRLPLSQRLRETSGRHCSDPHDKIYALLSLIDEDEERQLRPDYRKPFRDLVLEVSEVLRGHDNLDETRDCDLIGLFELESCVETALTSGKPLHQYTKALQEASHEGYDKVVKALLVRCASLITTKSHIENALLAAAGMNRESVVRLLLAAEADVNAQGGCCGNALQAASQAGHEKVVQILLAAGADVNAQGGHYGSTLQAASQAGHEKVVQILLAAGADVSAQGGWFGEVLQAASERGDENVNQMLVGAGADVNAREGYYGNALYAASQGGHEKVVQMLLLAAARMNRESVVRMLLAAEADVDAQGGYYGNSLQAASVGGHEKVVQTLLAAGADVNTQGGHYGNALQAASVGGHEKVVRLRNNQSD